MHRKNYDTKKTNGRRDTEKERKKERKKECFWCCVKHSTQSRPQRRWLSNGINARQEREEEEEEDTIFPFFFFSFFHLRDRQHYFGTGKQIQICQRPIVQDFFHFSLQERFVVEKSVVH
jgi:hypothetical protein